MTSIYLHGQLGKELGEKWDLNIDSVAEAISAIDANTGKLINFIQSKLQDNIGYNIVVDEEEISEEDLLCKTPKKEIHITAVVEGAKGGAINIIAGIALIAAPYLASTMGATIFGGAAASAGLGAVYGGLNFFGNMVVSLGLSLVMGGITELMTKTPTMGEGKSTQSYLFQGNVNNQLQGQAVPIGYGRLRVGSQVIGLFQSNHLLPDGGRSYAAYQEKRKAAWSRAVASWLVQTEQEFENHKKNGSLPRYKSDHHRKYKPKNVDEYRKHFGDEIYVSSASFKTKHGSREIFTQEQMTRNLPESFRMDI